MAKNSHLYPHFLALATPLIKSYLGMAGVEGTPKFTKKTLWPNAKNKDILHDHDVL